MAGEIPCPRCAQLVNPQSRFCEHCGVDLALAAVVAEREVLPLPDLPEGVPLAPEVLVPRIGDYLIEKGLLHKEDLRAALNYQKQRAEEGVPILVGQALLELNLVDRETLDQVITFQIFNLHNALSEANQQLEHRVQERTIELQRALDRLAELNQLKSNFIANISHELRTPLTHIKGYLDILSEGGLGPLEEKQIDALKIMQRAEERLERLIEDLIQFSLASRGELSLKLSTFSLEKSIRSVVSRVEHKARQGNIALRVVLPESFPWVEADEEKISWVLLHLLDNSLKFTPDGGQVEVKAAPEISWVLISVTDTGIGIPKDRMNEIFEPFHQLDGSATRHYGGTGLGLAMVRRIIEAHGSQIRVRSMVGKGSCFEFSLPVAKNGLG